MPTYKEIDQAQRTITLLIHPGTPQQRSFWKVLAEQTGHQANAVAKARAKYGNVPMAWMAADGTLTAVI